MDGCQFYELGISRTIGSFGGRLSIATTDRRAERTLGEEVAGTHASVQLSWFFKRPTTAGVPSMLLGRPASASIAGGHAGAGAGVRDAGGVLPEAIA